MSSEGFYELDVAAGAARRPGPEPRSPERGEQWVERTLHYVSTDPGGCWVAEVDGEMVGFATSFTAS